MADEAELEVGSPPYWNATRRLPASSLWVAPSTHLGERRGAPAELGCVRRRVATPAEHDAIAGRCELWARAWWQRLSREPAGGFLGGYPAVMVTDDRFTRANAVFQC